MSLERSLQRILLVEDDPNDRLLAIRELKREFPQVQVQEIVNWAELELALASNTFDLVITDYNLQWTTGLDVLQAVRKGDPHRPVVMFTDSATQEVAVMAMKAGLNDYVLKSPKHIIRLSQAVRSAWENMQTRRRASELDGRLKFLLNELHVGVFRRTLAGQLVEVSDGFLKLLGLNSLTEAQAFLQTHLRGAGANPTAQQWHHEVQLEDINSQPLWLQISETLVQLDGQTWVDGLISNITQQKETAAALQSLNQTLEQRVHQRTAHLKNLNRELEMFAFSVSHDLRSPIRQIDGFVALLEKYLQDNQSEALVEPTNPDSVPHYLQRIRLLTERAGQMIDDLLQFSRTGRAEMHYGQVSMTRLVQEVVRQVDPDSEASKICWEIEPLPPAWGDRNLLCVVWQNLIENAVKYTLPREVAKIRIASELRENETVYLIQDNGIGFDVDDAKNIFGVFQRLPNAESFEGTGVGLANVQRIIHRHHGQLWAEGQLDLGATFYFSLPEENMAAAL